MKKRVEAVLAGRAVLRFAVLSAGLVLLSTLGVRLAQADHTPVHGTPLARGSFDPSERINLKMQAHVAGKVDTVQVHDAADVVFSQITIQPGASIGWHSHPGPAVVVVQQGTLTIYDGEDPTCTGRRYGPGEGGAAFVDLGQGHVHNAANEGTTVVSVYVTYFDVPPGEVPLNLVANQGDFPSCFP
jgi:quercetin dioxygenase-like cupin family protein